MRKEATAPYICSSGRGQLASGPEHGRGDCVQVRLALTGGPRPAPLAHRIDLAPKRLPADHGAIGEPLERPYERELRAEREHHLARGGGVGDAGPADPGHRRHAGVAGDEVDRDGVRLRRERERGRLAQRTLELFQVRPPHDAQVEASDDMVGQRQQVRAQAVAAGVGDVLDVPGVDQGRERARDGARVDPGQARQLGCARVAADAQERVQNAQGALDCGQAPLGRSAGGRHRRIIAQTRRKGSGAEYLTRSVNIRCLTPSRGR